MGNNLGNSTQRLSFNFIGYFLKESSFSQKDLVERKIDRFFLKVEPIELQPGENRFDLSLQLYSEGFEARFLFTCLFEVGEKNFRELTADENDQNQRAMLDVVFPFVRQAIANATNDSLNQVLLPTISLQGLSVFSGVSFIRADLQKRNKSE